MNILQAIADSNLFAAWFKDQVGRCGGKSFICVLIGVYLATFRVYQLASGERAIVMLIAADRRQARVLFRYTKAFVEGMAMLRQMVENITADAIEFTGEDGRAPDLPLDRGGTGL